MKSVTSAESTEIPDANASLDLARSSVNDYFLYPAVLRFKPMGIALDLGLGIYISAQSEREVGYFQLDGLSALGKAALNSYDNDFNTTFYGPAATASASFSFPHVRGRVSGILVPLFAYEYSQAISIDPLVSTEGKNDFTSYGFPYFGIKLEPVFFGFLAPAIDYEYQHFKYTLIDIDPNSLASTPAWKESEATYGVHSLILRGNIRIPLFDRGEASLGYGRKLVWTVPESGNASFSSKNTYTLAFDLHK
jgi:hypothetical protein